MNKIRKCRFNIIILLFILLLSSCAAMRTSIGLQEGKRNFNAGYYKSAMHDLLPLASDGHKEAQYAIGYMYYYGYGVAQDTEVAYFWIKRSADQQYGPAIKALEMMKNKKKSL